MKITTAIILAFTTATTPSFAQTQNTNTAWLKLISQEIAHGGGCRKSSPAGQCCHKQKSTGQVHCH